MKNKTTIVKLGAIVLVLGVAIFISCTKTPINNKPDVSQELEAVLKQKGFTGSIESKLEERLGRPLNKDLAELGKLIFFDSFLGLREENSCASCHSPTVGFGDTQSIAIGVGSNEIVGPNRKGQRNQRRTPTVINSAFFPALMWNGRFSAPTDNPFDNSKGYAFPPPEGVKPQEGTKEFPPNHPQIKHLLIAQGHIPPTEMPEMAGFNYPKNEKNPSFTTERFQQRVSQSKSLEIRNSPANAPDALRVQVFSSKIATTSEDPTYEQFDDDKGTELPPEEDIDGNKTRNYGIRRMVVERFNRNAEYKKLFAQVFPEVAQGKPITYVMIGQALSEFQLSLTFAKAPIDKFALGDHSAMTLEQQRGALIFFDRNKTNCASCHAVSGSANEMFSDFQVYNIGVPQIAPTFGKGRGDVPFRNQNGDLSTQGTQDFGLEDITGDAKDRYLFRTSSLRNVSLQPAFFHNGAFTRLEDAVRHHLNVYESVKNYNAAKVGVAPDIDKIAPMEPILATLDSRVKTPITLTDQEFNDLIAFIRDALLDERAKPENLKKIVPGAVPSGNKLPTFEFPSP